MLVTLAEAKTYLGEGGTTYDTKLTQQLQMFSDAVEGYCGRVFEEKNWIQTWYRDDYDFIPGRLPMYHYPVSEITYVREAITLAEIAAATDIATTEYRLHSPTGFITRQRCFSFTELPVLQVKYKAGYAANAIPTTVKQVIYNLIQESYNRIKAGVALNFGSDVQSIAIPGVISVQFDYTLSSNERTNTYGSILGSQLNILDLWRSERAIPTSGALLEYVDVVVP